MLKILSFLWAAGIAVHQAHFKAVEAWPHLALNLAAILVLLRPGSAARFGALVAAHLVCIAWELPFVSNHWMLLWFGDLAVLAALLGQRPRSAEQLWLRVAPQLRAQLAVLYGFAVLHKLNTAYFDPGLSCGAEHLVKLAERVPLVPTAPWAMVVSMVGVLVIELALPVLLYVRRTRYAAIVAGTCFHLVLGINGYHDFSAIALVYYCAFLPDDMPVRLRDLAARPGLDRLTGGAAALARAPSTQAVAVVAVLVCAGLPAWLDLTGPQKHALFDVPSRVLWLVGDLTLIAVLVACRRPTTAAAAPTPPPSPRPVRLAGTAVLALLTLNGLCPYLGLKTESSFAMFSNLQTEGALWNHLFVPRGIKVFGWQDDLVDVVSTTDPRLNDTVRIAAPRGSDGTAPRYRLAWLEFHRLMSYAPDAAVTYRRGDATIEVPRVGDDPRLSRPLPPVASKLLWLRPVAPPEHNHCRH